jgi:hypothetical protein
MLSKLLSIFSVLDWVFSWLHDQSIRRQIATEQQLDLQRGKTLRVKVDAESARMTDDQHNARLEKTGGLP